jgi:hypothetical protein
MSDPASMLNATIDPRNWARGRNLLVAAFLALALLAVAGCQSTHHGSARGEVVPLDEEFSITVPTVFLVKATAQ